MIRFQGLKSIATQWKLLNRKNYLHFLSRSFVEHTFSDDRFIPGGSITTRQSKHIRCITVHSASSSRHAFRYSPTTASHCQLNTRQTFVRSSRQIKPTSGRNKGVDSWLSRNQISRFKRGNSLALSAGIISRCRGEIKLRACLQLFAKVFQHSFGYITCRLRVLSFLQELLHCLNCLNCLMLTV